MIYNRTRFVIQQAKLKHGIRNINPLKKFSRMARLGGAEGAKQPSHHERYAPFSQLIAQ